MGFHRDYFLKWWRLFSQIVEIIFSKGIIFSNGRGYVLKWCKLFSLIVEIIFSQMVEIFFSNDGGYFLKWWRFFHKWWRLFSQMMEVIFCYRYFCLSPSFHFSQLLSGLVKLINVYLLPSLVDSSLLPPTPSFP